MEYMSASQFKAFRKCEAAALAELTGEYVRPESTALLVGSFVDAFFSGELNDFMEQNPQIFKRDGTLKAEYVAAEKICKRLLSDDLARLLLSGKHQVIKIGKIAGVPYKIKMDSLLSEDQVAEICERFPEVKKLVPFGGEMIVDLKVMRDFESIWDPELLQKVNFIEFWGYDFQGAIYQHIDGNYSPFVIMAATKEAEPDILALHIPDSDLAAKLAEVEELSPRYAAIKRGEIEPKPCGRCQWCRSRRRLTEIMNYRGLG